MGRKLPGRGRVVPTCPGWDIASMRVTTWTEYSLIIALHLAKRGRGAPDPIAARELAEVERLPSEYVEQILLRLRRAGLVESVRGARGGYYRSEEHTSELQSQSNLVCRLLLEKKKKKKISRTYLD